MNHHDSGVTLIRDDHWNLDLLGNWSGANGRVMNSDITDDRTEEHNVDNRNQISSIDRAVNGGSSSNTPTRFDAAGHVEFQFTGMGGNVVYRQRPGGRDRADVARRAGACGEDGDGGAAADQRGGQLRAGDGADGLRVRRGRQRAAHDALRAGVGANVHSPALLQLDKSNAVWSRTFNWHDANRRLVASADYGTSESEGARYVVSDEPPEPAWHNTTAALTEWPRIDPAASSNQVLRGSVPSGVPLTIYHYAVAAIRTTRRRPRGP